MENSYPYIGEKIQVTQDMCDLNGHMNVVFYVHILNMAVWIFIITWVFLLSISLRVFLISP